MRYPVEVSPAEWMLPDRSGFLEWVHATFRYPAKSTGQGAGLFVQQRFVRDYLQPSSPYRGLILFHGLGVGKSAASIAAAEALRGAGRSVVVMTPASLRRSYIEQIKLHGAAEFDRDQRWVEREGGWRVNAEAGMPFADLRASEQDAVDALLSKRVRAEYVFISYNGLTAAAVRELTRGEKNPFDDRVVIIDEAHNFISRVSKNGLLAGVYQRMLDAQGCKVIMLSGTPVVNRPNELAYLTDLAMGYSDVVEVRFGPGGARDEAALLADVHAIEGVDRGEFSEDATVLRVRLLPEGFAWAPGKTGFVRPVAPAARDSAQGVIDRVAKVTSGYGSVRGTQLTRRLSLPTDAPAFEALFIRYEDDALAGRARRTIMHASVLERRIVGCVSFFRAYDPELYPSVSKTRVVQVALSARQFTEYAVKRDVERKREEASQRFARRRQGRHDDAEDGGGQIYRAYSRSLCNFTFPEGIARPYLSDMRQIMDDPEADGSGDEGEGEAGADARARKRTLNKKYAQALQDAIARTEAHPSALKLGPGGGLAEHAPKFARIIEHLHAHRKLSVVYSTFKAVEGIGLLTAALRCNGWSQLFVERVGAGRELTFALRGTDPLRSVADGRVYTVYENNDDEEAGQAMLNAFNSNSDKLPSSARDSLARLYGGAGLTNDHGELVRLLLLTPSGAEGLNLRNVREVHLMEPFWHVNRIDQVIGRAVRARSHLALPPAERHVDIFMYVATLTPAQCKNNTTIRLKDKCMSSDEFVHEVALRKKATIESLLDIMRRASVDCRVHQASHGNRVRCTESRTPGVATGQPAHRLLVEDDVAEDRAAGRSMSIVTDKSGRRLLWDRATGDVFDHAHFVATGQLKRVGRMRSHPSDEP